MGQRRSAAFERREDEGSRPPSGWAHRVIIEAVERKVWSAEELERMTPAEQDAIFESSLIDRLDDVPPEFIERVRSRVQQRIFRSDAPERR